MPQNTAKIINFEQFRATRAVPVNDSSAAMSMQQLLPFVAAVPAVCFYYWPCPPVVYWPGVIGG